MIGQHLPGARCGDCAFWSRMDGQGGNCRLRAPRPASSANEIVHWPRTGQDDYCGEWQPRNAAMPQLVLCKRCLYWSHPENGLMPVDRGDQLSDWWAGAGHCLRFSPAPSSTPGNRAFWSATNESDACAQGKQRPA